MRSKIKVICFSSLVCLVVSACPWAGWIEDGIPLTPHTGYGGGMVLVSDGSSGAFIAYEVCRDAASYITVQRLDSEGDILWGDEGVVVCSEAGGQYSPQITSDGSGGLIVAWSDYRSGSYDIYAQRVDGSGTVLWQADGVPLCTEANSQYAPQITSDGSGGAIVTWQDARSGNSDIYAQHVDGSGSVQWQTDGVPLCTAEGDQYKTQIISDGSSGAIVTWEDERSGEYVSDIYAQRVDATGLTLWQADGVPLCTAAGWQLNPKITSSGSGGAIVIWNDDRSYSYDIYAQRVDGSGMVQWQTDGIPLCMKEGNQRDPQITSDGSVGAIVTWSDPRSVNPGIYAQRVDFFGTTLWQVDGVPICTAVGYQTYPQITSDGSGGAIVTWGDERSGYYFSDIYAQRVDGAGSALWTANGVPICTAANSQVGPQITSDGSGGAIVMWGDRRSGYYDIYAQRVDGSGLALWQADGIPVCTAAGYQNFPQITSDGSEGAIVTWEDERSGNSDIYAQRVDGSGLALWQAGGVPLCTAANSQSDPEITSDGLGGAIITWEDSRSWNPGIYAQRIDALGLTLWAINGVPLCTAAGDQERPQITSDGYGGAIVTWWDWRSGNVDIYAQRVDGFGTILWQANGIPICTAAEWQYSAQITTDGSGGAIITWHDYRNGNFDIYAQRVDGSGTVQWQVDGISLCTATGYQIDPQIISDGSGGAIVTWVDRRSGNYDIYAQCVDASGTVLWQADGVPLCTATGIRDNPQITTDGSGGAIVAWGDTRSGSNYDIYAQRVDGSGTVLWQTDGVPLCTAVNSQYYLQITSDGSGGAIVTWHDYRSGSYSDIYAQRVDGSGTVQWQADGIPLCTAAEDQEYPQIATDEAGGAIVTWHDYRCSIPHIYVARVSGSGDLVATLLQTFSARLESNSVFISWTLSEIDESASFTVLRASAPDWIYSEIENAAIEREGLSFSFTDTAVLPGSLCKYRIDVETESTPTRTLFETEEITVPALPLTLYQNHPNPFNPNTTIRFYLPEAGEVSLDIYNVAGQRVRRLAEGRMEKGYQEVLWDGRNSAGADCSSGIYFYRLRAGKSSISKKMVLLR